MSRYARTIKGSRAQFMRELWKDPEYRGKVLRTVNSESVKKTISNNMKTRWSTDEFRQKNSTAIKKGWTPELREWKSRQMKAKARGESYVPFEEWKKSMEKTLSPEEFAEFERKREEEELRMEAERKARKDAERAAEKASAPPKKKVPQKPKTREDRMMDAYNAGMTRFLKMQRKLAEERRKRLRGY